MVEEEVERWTKRMQVRAEARLYRPQPSMHSIATSAWKVLEQRGLEGSGGFWNVRDGARVDAPRRFWKVPEAGMPECARMLRNVLEAERVARGERAWHGEENGACRSGRLDRMAQARGDSLY